MLVMFSSIFCGGQKSRSSFDYAILNTTCSLQRSLTPMQLTTKFLRINFKATRDYKKLNVLTSITS